VRKMFPGRTIPRAIQLFRAVAASLPLGCANPAFERTFTQFPIPPANNQPIGITPGPDGGEEYIGRITTAGAVSEFALPTKFSGAFDITTGPDGMRMTGSSTSGEPEPASVNATSGAQYAQDGPHSALAVLPHGP
jgi:hypothetical protein